MKDNNTSDQLLDRQIFLSLKCRKSGWTLEKTIVRQIQVSYQSRLIVWNASEQKKTIYHLLPSFFFDIDKNNTAWELSGIIISPVSIFH